MKRAVFLTGGTPIHPQVESTRIDPNTREWIPVSFTDFLDELVGLQAVIMAGNSPALFRGHARRSWRLDSTFARNIKQVLFGLPPDASISSRVAESVDYHLAVLNLFLLKFGVLVQPSSQLDHEATKGGCDSWFELMKHFQQYPEEDRGFIRGTNLLDWTQSPKVALYFANYRRSGEGAIYVCDARATGNTLQTKLVGEILDLMKKLGNSGRPLGRPLLFFPPKQFAILRAINQQAVYFAQMDLRSDMESQWRAVERDTPGAQIIVKLVLPAGTEHEVAEYLVENGITEEFVFPEEA